MDHTQQCSGALCGARDQAVGSCGHHLCLQPRILSQTHANFMLTSIKWEGKKMDSSAQSLDGPEDLVVEPGKHPNSLGQVHPPPGALFPRVKRHQDLGQRAVVQNKVGKDVRAPGAERAVGSSSGCFSLLQHLLIPSRNTPPTPCQLYRVRKLVGFLWVTSHKPAE